MMQTFLPYPSFRESAKSLDNKRLGKQRVECKQIMLALGYSVGEHQGDPESRWRHHPAVRMWRGGELWLAEYAMAVCYEWDDRGYRDSLYSQFHNLWAWMLSCPSRSSMTRPSWIGMSAFHASHRSNLLRKLPSHYSKFCWREPPTLEYVWPV